MNPVSGQVFGSNTGQEYAGRQYCADSRGRLRGNLRCSWRDFLVFALSMIDSALILRHRVDSQVGIHFPGLTRSHARFQFLDGSDVPFDKFDAELRGFPRQLRGLDGS